MGSDVIMRTVALFSVEYHHSRNLREKTARGSMLEASHCRRLFPVLSCGSVSSAHLLRHRPVNNNHNNSNTFNVTVKP